MTITLVCSGLLAILLLFLAIHVVVGRVKLKVNDGDGGSADMRQRIRAMANFSEYVPIALLLLFFVEKEAIGPSWLAVALGVTLVLARLWHAQGMLSKEGPSIGRFMGTNLTWLVLLVGAGASIGRGAGLF